MIQRRLNDAAVALYRVLSAAGIEHGLLGGYAIATLGGPRETKRSRLPCLSEQGTNHQYPEWESWL